VHGASGVGSGQATSGRRNRLATLILNRALPAMPDAAQARAEAIEEVRMLLADKDGAALTGRPA